jgi:hypothetical protein
MNGFFYGINFCGIGETNVKSPNIILRRQKYNIRRLCYGIFENAIG